MASLLWAVYALPWSVRIYAYYMAEVLTGTAVGLFVGFLQRRGAGFVALVCLLPPAYLQYVNRFSHPATGRRLFLLLLGTAVELSMAFVVAHRLSKARKRVASEANS
jgi:hypothetical protein